MAEPIGDRPYIAHPEYGVPKDEKNLVPWSWVRERFEVELNYWVGTVGRDGDPHVRPVWGVFVDDTIHFGGGPRTMWSRNLAANRRVSVHLESGSEVVIAEGRVDRIEGAGDPRLSAIDDAYEVKYNMRHGPPIWVLRPSLVLAWKSFPKDVTRFRFEHG
ncbi:MAG: pyridoxamine 5'-phosphate oxidase family protein [Actinomycetota bacterium]